MSEREGEVDGNGDVESGNSARAGVGVVVKRDDSDGEGSAVGRGRRLLRSRNILLGVVGLAVLLVLWQVVWAMTAKHGPVGDHAGALRAIALRAQGVDVVDETVSEEEAERVGGQGWRELQRALEKYDTARNAAVDRYGTEAPAELIPPGEPFLPFDWPIDGNALRKGSGAPAELVEQTREALDLFVESGGLDLLDLGIAADVVVRDYPVIHPLKPEPRFGWLGQTRGLASLLTGRMHEAAASHRTEEARLWCIRCLRLGASYTRHASTIEHLIGYSILSNVYSAIGELISAGRLSESVAAALLEELNDFSMAERVPGMDGLGSVATAVRSEQVTMLRLIDYLHTKGGRLILTELHTYENLAASVAAGTLGQEPAYYKLVNVSGLAYPSKPQTIRDVDRFFSAIIEPIESREGAARHAGFDPDVFLEELPSRQRIVPILPQVIPLLVKFWWEARQSVELTRLGLAAELYRLRTGEIPRDAAVLVGTVLDEPVREPVELWRDASEGRALTFDDLSSELARRIGLTGVGGE